MPGVIERNFLIIDCHQIEKKNVSPTKIIREYDFPVNFDFLPCTYPLISCLLPMFFTWLIFFYFKRY